MLIFFSESKNFVFFFQSPRFCWNFDNVKIFNKIMDSEKITTNHGLWKNYNKSWTLSKFSKKNLGLWKNTTKSWTLKKKYKIFELWKIFQKKSWTLKNFNKSWRLCQITTKRSICGMGYIRGQYVAWGIQRAICGMGGIGGQYLAPLYLLMYNKWV